MNFAKTAFYVFFSLSIFSAETLFSAPVTHAFSENVQCEFSGQWSETMAKRALIQVTQRGDAYEVSITWPNGAAEKTFWYITAIPDGPDTFIYNDCTCVTRTYNQSGGFTEHIRYEDGTGYFTVDGDVLIWIDEIEGIANDSKFDRI